MLERGTPLELAFAVLALALLTFAAAAQDQPPAQRRADEGHRPITEDLSQGTSFTFKIAPNLPEFTFKVVPEVRYELGTVLSTVREVEVFRGNSDEPLQHLTGCNWRRMEPPPAGSDWFHTDDFNFDGYQDIYVMTNWGATGNANGCVWLYNPATGHFDYSKDFSALSAYELDSNTKTIFTFEKSGWQVFTAQKYKVEHNRPVLIWSEDQDWDFGGKQFHCVVKERRGNEMVTVRDEWGNSDEGVGPCDPSKLFQHPAPVKSPTK